MREFKVSQDGFPPHHILSLLPFQVMSGPCEKAGFTCFNVSHTFLTKSLSWKQIAVSSFSMRSAQWRERRIPRGAAETQGEKGAEAAAPAQCIS